MWRRSRTGVRSRRQQCHRDLRADSRASGSDANRARRTHRSTQQRRALRRSCVASPLTPSDHDSRAAVLYHLCSDFRGPIVTRRFPATRLRRNRYRDFSRRLVRETELGVNDLIYPIFVIEGHDVAEPVATMPGIERLSIDRLVRECETLARLRVPAIALFPKVAPNLKTPDGSEAWNPDGLIPRAVAAVKRAVPELGVITDAALDPYTTHGQDGILDEHGYVANDLTVTALCRQAQICAAAGSDVIAPSDMMDGRVGAIRSMLEEHGFPNTQIMAYSAKYASAYYGPF